MEKSESEQKIAQLQMMEQNLQNILIQKQQFQSQLLEIGNALNELKETNKAYKIVGNIMVASSKESLNKDLNEKKQMLEIRIKNIEKQEQSIKEKSKKLQQEILSSIKGKNE
jgi:prefoldin beta subunit